EKEGKGREHWHGWNFCTINNRRNGYQRHVYHVEGIPNKRTALYEDKASSSSSLPGYMSVSYCPVVTSLFGDFLIQQTSRTILTGVDRSSFYPQFQDKALFSFHNNRDHAHSTKSLLLQ
ncbi:hypothetical protein FRC18_012214, partial [Serendipita sp. 400]